MKLDNIRMLVTLVNGDMYMINENTESLYDIVDNHLIMHDIKIHLQKVERRRRRSWRNR